MDILTQGLLGAAAAQSSVPMTKVKAKATLIGFLSGLLADTDVFFRLLTSHPLDPIVLHRQLTHSIFFMPIGALIVALVFCVFKKNRPYFKSIYWASLFGYATHALLDCCTSYGTQLFYPFSNVRIAWDSIAIIDPIYTFILSIGVLFSYLSRKQNKPNAHKPALIAIVLSTLYLGLGFYQNHKTLKAHKQIATFRGHEPNSLEFKKHRAFPAIGSLFLWRTVYQYKDQFYSDAIWTPFIGTPRWKQGPALKAFELSKSNHPIFNFSEAKKSLKIFDWFTDGYLTKLPSSENEIIVADVRYSMASQKYEPIWWVRVNGPNIQDTYYEFSHRNNNTQVLKSSRLQRLKQLREDLFSMGAGFSSLPPTVDR